MNRARDVVRVRSLEQIRQQSVKTSVFFYSLIATLMSLIPWQAFSTPISRQDIRSYSPKIEWALDSTNSMTVEEIADSAVFQTLENIDYRGGKNNWLKIGFLENHNPKKFWIVSHHIYEVYLYSNGVGVKIEPQELGMHAVEPCSHCMIFMKTSFPASLNYAIGFVPDEDFIDEFSNRSLHHVLLKSIYLVLGILNLVQYLSTRRSYYFAYILVQIAGFLYLETWESSFFGWEWHLTFHLTTQSLFVICFNEFIIQCIGAKNLSPILLKMARFCSLLVSLVPFFHQLSPIIWQIFTLNLIVVLILALQGVYRVRRHTYFLLIAWLMPFLGYFSSWAYRIGWLSSYPEYLFSYSLCADSIFFSFAIGQAYRNEIVDALKLNISLRKDSERLSANLADINKNLDVIVTSRTRDMRAIFDSIGIGIFTIKPEKLLIGPNYSLHTLEILGVSSIASKSFQEVFLDRLLIPQDQKELCRAVLDAVLEQSTVNFELNRGNLPTHAAFKNKTSEIALKIKWEPIVDSNDQVTEMMVLLQEDGVANQESSNDDELQRVLPYVQALIIAGKRNALMFIERADGMIAEVVNCIRNHATVAIDRQRVLQFLHTLKGNARTLGFSEMAEKAHRTEHDLITLQDGMSLETLLTDCRALQETLATIKTIATTHLHWSHSNEVNIDVKIVADLLSSYQDHASEGNPLVDNKIGSLSAAAGLEIKVILQKIFDQISPTAVDLGKNVPRLEISGDVFSMTPHTLDTVQKIFPHMFTNAIDHGLESPTERVAKNKNPTGCIQIYVKRNGNCVVIKFGDDGAGLNLEKLEIKLGERSNSRPNSRLLLANSIFEPELSTKSQVSIYSGRGIGLSAVKDELESAGGQIEIALLDSNDPLSGCRFEFKITIINR